jgi:hypothetical protein
MGMQLLISSLAIVAALSSVAEAYDLSKVKVEDRRDSNGIRRVVILERDAVSKCPEWQPEKGWPPIPVDKALASARAKLKEQNPKVDDFELQEVALKSFRDSRLPNRWYYVFDFDPVLDGNLLFGSMYYAVVLMDGTALLPEVQASGDGSERW